MPGDRPCAQAGPVKEVQVAPEPLQVRNLFFVFLEVRQGLEIPGVSFQSIGGQSLLDSAIIEKRADFWPWKQLRARMWRFPHCANDTISAKLFETNWTRKVSLWPARPLRRY